MGNIAQESAHDFSSSELHHNDDNEFSDDEMDCLPSIIQPTIFCNKNKNQSNKRANYKKRKTRSFDQVAMEVEKDRQKMIAANNNNFHFDDDNSHTNNENNDYHDQVDSRKSNGARRERLQDIWKGDVGLTLFMPLYWDQFPPLSEAIRTPPSGYCSSQDEVGRSNYDEEEDFDDEEEDFVQMEDEDNDLPHILNDRQLSSIQTQGLPPSVRLMTWTRIYSLRRDGDLFQTMIKKCSNYQNTLVVIKTYDGDILGGYAEKPWCNESGDHTSAKRARSFFGGGRSFLYATNPHLNDEEKKMDENNDSNYVYFYKWTGINEYNQLCDVNSEILAMGGGGDFGWYVERNFTIGSTGRCSTFNNPPLTKGTDGKFEVLDFEVYGFKNMSHRHFEFSESMRVLAPKHTRSSSSFSSSMRSIDSAAMHLSIRDSLKALST